MDDDLPNRIHFLLQTTSKHDCFFNVGPESGPKVRIGAIKILLMAESEVFLRMLDESPLAEKEDIPVIDSDPETFMNFLKCIYGGTNIVVRKISFEKCMSLLYLCEKYLTYEIHEMIISLIFQLHQPLTVNHVMICLSIPACITNTSDRLAMAVSKFIQKNTEKILQHRSFLDLDSSAVELISKQDIISTEEINLWKAVLKWAQAKVHPGDPKAVRTQLKNILKHIRFCAMKGNEFCESVVPSQVLTLEEVFGINMSIGTKSPQKMDELNGEVLGRTKSPLLEISFSKVFYNIKDIKGPIQSSRYKLGEVNWFIEVLKAEEVHFGIFLYCSSSNKKSCKIHAKYTFELVDHMTGNNLIMSSSHEFTSGGSGRGYSPFISFEELVNIEMGYIKNNAVEIITTVELI